MTRREALDPHFDDAHSAGGGEAGRSSGAGCGPRDECLRHLFRRPGGRRGTRRVADVRAESRDVHGRLPNSRSWDLVGAGGRPPHPPPIYSATLLEVRNVARSIRMSPVIGPGFWGAPPPRSSRSTSPPPSSLAQRTPRAHPSVSGVTGIGIYVGWNLSTLAETPCSATCSATLRACGLDAAAAAHFLTLLWPRLRARQPIIVGVAAAVVATVLDAGTHARVAGDRRGGRRDPRRLDQLAQQGRCGGCRRAGRRRRGAGRYCRDHVDRSARGRRSMCVALKTVGYLIPPRWVGAPTPLRIADLLTVALGARSRRRAGARRGSRPSWSTPACPPCSVARAGLLLLRAPFLVVVDRRGSRGGAAPAVGLGGVRPPSNARPREPAPALQARSVPSRHASSVPARVGS